MNVTLYLDDADRPRLTITTTPYDPNERLLLRLFAERLNGGRETVTKIDDDPSAMSAYLMVSWNEGER